MENMNWAIDPKKPTKYYVIIGLEEKVAVSALTPKEAAVSVLVKKIVSGIEDAKKSNTGSYSMLSPVDVVVSTCGAMTPDEFEDDFKKDIYKGIYNNLSELDKAWSAGHEKDHIFDAEQLFQDVSKKLNEYFGKEGADSSDSDFDDCDDSADFDE